MESIDLTENEMESETKAEEEDLRYIKEESFRCIAVLDQAVERLELLRKAAADKGFTKLSDHAAEWYRKEPQDHAATKRGYQYREVWWGLDIIEDDATDSHLTEEAKHWHDFQEANYDVVTKAGFVLDSGVYGKNKTTCELCFARVSHAIDRLEADLCEDWQSFVPFELLNITMIAAEKPNPESFAGFGQVVRLAAEKFPQFFVQKTEGVVSNLEDESKPTLVERKERAVIKTDDVVSLMFDKGKIELSNILRDVRDDAPQRNPITVRVGKDVGVVRVSGSSVCKVADTRVEELVEAAASKHSADGRGEEMVNGEIAPAPAIPPAPPPNNVAVRGRVGRLCDSFLKLICCGK